MLDVGPNAYSNIWFFPLVCDKAIHGGVKLSPAKWLRPQSQLLWGGENKCFLLTKGQAHRKHLAEYRESFWQCSGSLLPMCVLGERLAGVLGGRPYHVDAATLLSLFWKFSKYLKDLSSW